MLRTQKRSLTLLLGLAAFCLDQALDTCRLALQEVALLLGVVAGQRGFVKGARLLKLAADLDSGRR